MVKQAEKIRKRSPLLPVFGLGLALALAVIAYVLVEPLAQLITRLFPQSGFRNSLGTPIYFDLLAAKPLVPSWPRLGVAFAIWLILLALSYAFVAFAAGKDPESAKQIVLPPRDKDSKKRR